MQLSLAALFVLLSVINNGAMLEQKSWVFYLDYFRLIVIVAFLSTLQISGYIPLTLAIILLSVIFVFRTAKQQYQFFLYHQRVLS
jgi:hypothetical protein